MNESTALITGVSSRAGSISKVSSGGLDPIHLSYSMCMAKAAQNMLSASLHREHRKTDIAVFACHPGKILTRMVSPDADMSAGPARL